jgi:hypothetical protein
VDLEVPCSSQGGGTSNINMLCSQPWGAFGSGRSQGAPGDNKRPNAPKVPPTWAPGVAKGAAFEARPGRTNGGALVEVPRSKLRISAAPPPRRIFLYGAVENRADFL